MAPSGRIRTRSSSTARKTTTTRRRRKTTQLKNIKQIVGPTKNQEAFTQNSSSNEFLKIENNKIDKFEGVINVDNDDDDDGVSTSECSTPKAQRFRIPEIVTCPPAPKKQRVVSDFSTLQRSPIAFYAPPDLELFFSFALRGISV
ncbi:uncharacterized protein LOC107412600 [Ziziphus jujuba]|uniref:Uncharacterized protein LOC107412600 n=2 Tax=Ziziphus jujuba TaxID=326968 RepID=A0A6P3ZL32_ZIZJJ|nr:uncharacterized protein LOC107412600 [Ziziphus jujuba]KAH7543537.1 hypothetical protein FEM48_Zijuj02G0194400 [Ziziphus jujuba var. spinosa]